MREPQPSEIRVGDAEREQALRALGEHMSAGRLDIEEYGERTAKVAATKTRGDLLALFTDLPEPRPSFGDPVVQPPSQAKLAAVAAAESGGATVPWRDRPLSQRVYSALIPVSGIVALVLFLTVAKGVWFVFLLPAVLMVIGSRLWGEEWNRDRRAWHREQRQRRRYHHR